MKLFQISLLCICYESLFAFSSSNVTELKIAIKSLKKLYNFVEENRKDLNADGAFGISISTALLMLTQKDPKISKQLPGLKEVLIPIIDWGMMLSNISIDTNYMTEDYATLSRVLIDSKSWANLIGNPRPGHLRSLGAPDLKGVSFVLYESLNMKKTNTPTTQSDKCLAELITQKCHFSENCQSQIMDNKAFGYPLTHRLVHLIVAMFVGCDMSKYYKIEDRTAKLCAEILMESELLKRFGIPMSFRDLFIEQAMLCGAIVGYSEFQTEEYRQYPITWQEKNGCFKEYADAEKKYWEFISQESKAEVIEEMIKGTKVKEETALRSTDEYSQSASSQLGYDQKTVKESDDIFKMNLSLNQLMRNGLRYREKVANNLFVKPESFSKMALFTEAVREKRAIQNKVGLQQNIRKKRSSQNMGYDGCRSHITGLAAAYIAGNIRYVVYEILKGT